MKHVTVALRSAQLNVRRVLLTHTAAKPITFEKLIEMFPVSVRLKLRRHAHREGVTHLVVFENLQRDSSEFGKRAALNVGPGCTYTLDSILTQSARFGAVPSRFQYPVAYAPVPQRKKEAT